MITYVQSERMHNFPSPPLKLPKIEICFVSVEVNYSAVVRGRGIYCQAKLTVCPHERREGNLDLRWGEWSASRPGCFDSIYVSHLGVQNKHELRLKKEHASTEYTYNTI